MRTIYRAGCAIVLLWAVSDFAFVASAWAQSRQRIGFDINQPSLSKALLDFSAQSHIVVTLRSELVEGKSAPAVKGEMTPEEVLEKLLQGSGLRFKKGQEGEIVIEGPAPGEAKAVSPRAAPKRAASSRMEVEEVTVTASRLREESVQDTPIAVSVISAKTVETLHQTNIQALSAIVPNLNIMTKRFAERLTGSLAVRNLFNVAYATPGGFEHRVPAILQDGRNYLVRVEYSF